MDYVRSAASQENGIHNWDLRKPVKDIGAHCWFSVRIILLGWSGQDCALRRWGLAVEACGGSGEKERAIIVARKLAVLLHLLWMNGKHLFHLPLACPLWLIDEFSNDNPQRGIIVNRLTESGVVGFTAPDRVSGDCAMGSRSRAFPCQ